MLPDRETIIEALKAYIALNPGLSKNQYAAWLTAEHKLSRASGYRYVERLLAGGHSPQRPPEKAKPPKPDPGPPPPPDDGSADVPVFVEARLQRPLEADRIKAALPPVVEIDARELVSGEAMLKRFAQCFHDLDIIAAGLRTIDADGAIKIKNQPLMHANIRYRIEAMRALSEAVDSITNQERTREIWDAALAAIGRAAPDVQREIVRQLRLSNTTNLLPLMLEPADVVETQAKA
ncbi:MAG TPA: hypothetical protein PLN91_15210 [Rhodanobacteraceae bacterium]|nr:hypothetical protein [Rhodanobacteraceae bacterium]